MDIVTGYLAPVVTTSKGLPQALVVDLDGTLALMDGRGPFEWHRVGEDRLNTRLALLMDRMTRMPYDVADYPLHVLLVSGRDEVCRAETLGWLAEHDVFYDRLFMRPAGDLRDDREVKAEIFDRHVRGRYDVLAVFDDRGKVVRMWRDAGLLCLQVADGDF